MHIWDGKVGAGAGRV